MDIQASNNINIKDILNNYLCIEKIDFHIVKYVIKKKEC